LVVDWTFVLVVLAVAGFFGLIAWLRTDDNGELPSPGEPGDADKFPRIDSGG
jgi:hypothetical protein